MTRQVILALLRRHPMHGYEIQQYIREQKMDQWTDILSGSIYFALNQMEKEGLVRAEAEERTGNRLRKKYAITEKGETAFLELLHQALTSPPHNLKSEFSLGLIAFSENVLPPEERIRLLRQNIKNLERDRELWKTGQEVKSRFHPALKAYFANDLELIERDLRFLHELLAIDQESGKQTISPARTKATHLLMRTTGTYHGNPYTYQETVPVTGYQDSFWWQRFQSQPADEVLRQAADASDMDFFKIIDTETDTVTEILAICQE